MPKLTFSDVSKDGEPWYRPIVGAMQGIGSSRKHVLGQLAHDNLDTSLS